MVPISVPIKNNQLKKGHRHIGSAAPSRSPSRSLWFWSLPNSSQLAIAQSLIDLIVCEGIYRRT